jgi:3-phenylpropionate/trans-cinnamate dioxygenase ferredoxin reductase component
MSDKTFVIVGASLAGAKAAEALREQGFDGRVVLIGAEPERPYERPPLSKDYLRGESEREKTHVHEQGFYRQHEIELLTGTTVSAIDPAASRVTFEGAPDLAFDRLLLTTGAAPRQIQIDGAELEGVYYLRGTPRAPRWGRACCGRRRRLDRLRGRRLGAPARTRGHGDRSPGAAQRADLRPRDRRVLPRRVRQHGVELLLGEGVESFEGDTTVRRVRTASGKTVECDFAVVGVGVAPRVELAQAAGLEIDNGVVVDEHLCTSVANVFAAGDVANAWHPVFERRIRVEHWANALNQGPRLRGRCSVRTSASTGSRTSSQTSTR